MAKVDVIIAIDDDVNDESLFFNDRFIPEIITDRIKESNSEINFYYSLPTSYSGRLKSAGNCFVRENGDDIIFWKKFFSSVSSEHVAVISGDSLFFDPVILSEMSDIHLKYLAEFTFSENLPDGFACELISRELVNQVPDTDEKTLPLGRVVRANINRFDVELFYKEPDIRSKRISFRMNNLREKSIMQNLYNLNGSIPAYAEIKGLIDSNPDVLFNGPSYVELELTGKCSLDCIFCYRKSLKNGEHGHLSEQAFKSVLDGMRGFNLPYTLCLSGSGEPMEHPSFYSMLESAVKEPLVERIIVETNGVHAGMNFKSFVERTENSKVHVIVNNNGLDRESYIRFHGADQYDTVLKNITSLAGLNRDSNRVYIQVMKINETDEFAKANDTKTYLDRYYDFWESQKIPIILQKQNVYSARIPDRRYSDLSPVKRTPCWHLQRDIYILSDGTVSFCKQDIDGENSYGNVTASSLDEIWNRQRQMFLEDYKENYPEKPDCRNCDEWYTFNF